MDGRTVSVFPDAQPDAPVIYLNTVSSQEGGQVCQAARRDGCPPFTLVAIGGLDWNHDMSPWDSPPAFRNGQPFTGGALDHLQLLTRRILPEAEGGLGGTPLWRGIAGYSLAGLFALYAIYQTELFSRVASMSGSLWFPGMKEYIMSHAPRRRPECIYFSLGDRECKTRNPVLRQVGQNTEEIQSFYHSQGVDTTLVWNGGNHFDHPVERTAAGIRWLVSRQGSRQCASRPELHQEAQAEQNHL